MNFGRIRTYTLYIAVFLAVFVPVVAQAGVWPERAQIQALQDFYGARHHALVWTKDNGVWQRMAADVPAALDHARTHGLDPLDYNVPAIQTLISQPLPAEDLKMRRRADMQITQAIWLLASDLKGMPLTGADLTALLDSKDLVQGLDGLAPDALLYKALQDKLAALMAENAKNQQLITEKLGFGNGALRPDQLHPNVPRLRRLMVDYGAPAETAGDPTLYDSGLADAVKNFQALHGLGSDGVIGRDTLTLMNRSRAEEIRQVLANLDRLREPYRRAREPKRVDVSIARFELTAFENGEPVLTLPVVVGQPKRQTISFRTEISGVRLNPTWSVPPTIKREDFIPLLQTDPAKFQAKHPVRLYREGQQIDPMAVDWAALSPEDIAKVRMSQPAGVGNPLGQYRIIMENKYDIYLHDTNHRELFKSSMRALSSGCIRVQDPEKLTDFILGSKQGWSREKTDKIVQSKRTADVIIENKIPIYLDYLTSWLDYQGRLVMGRDVYKLDAPRYDDMVKDVLTNKRNAQKILNRVDDVFIQPLEETHSMQPHLSQASG